MWEVVNQLEVELVRLLVIDWYAVRMTLHLLSSCS